MLVCQRAVALAGHVGGLDVYCTLLRKSRTVMIDVLALLRSAKTLQWVRKNKVLCEGEKLTKELPVLFEAAGIPARSYVGVGILQSCFVIKQQLACFIIQQFDSRL